jgi:acetylornithine deacetylase
MSLDSLRKSELWEISRRLVSFNTVSTASDAQAAEYLANLLEESGFSVRLLRETAQGVEKVMVVAWAGPAQPGGLIVSGHIDIVPFDGQPGWKSDPLVMHAEGDRIFGRGVTDMKIFLAQTVIAAKHLSLDKLKRPLVYIFTCDEELAGQGAQHLVKTLPGIFKDYPLPSLALIGEPTNFAIFPAHKGFVIFDVLVHGKGGHSSAPNKGLSAIEKMGDVIQLLKETNVQLQRDVTPENVQLFPDYPASVFNCGTIEGGLASNMIAETCRMTVSARISPGDDADAMVTTLRQKIENDIARSMRAFNPSCGITLENIISAPPMSSSTDEAFCDLLCHIMGKTAQSGAPFATDGSHFQELGIHSYICGPGLLEEAHQPNESIPIANVTTGLDKLEQILNAWCGDRD